MIPLPRCMRGCSREPLPQTTDRGSLSDRPARLAARPAERPSGARKRRAWALSQVSGLVDALLPYPSQSLERKAAARPMRLRSCLAMKPTTGSGVRGARQRGNCWAHAFSPKTRSVEVAVGGRRMWLQAQSLVGLVAIPLIAWALSEQRGAIAPARLVRILLGRRRAAGADRRPDAERAGRARRLRLGGGSHRRAAVCHRRRHAPGVRLSGRRAGAVRDRAARDQLHPGVPGAAADPGDQRALQAALSLGRAAEDRRTPSAGCCSARSASPARSARRRQPTCSSAWWRRRCWCGPTSPP